LIRLTRHAKRRMHQRMGLPRRSLIRTACLALRYGLDIEEAPKSTHWSLCNQYAKCDAHLVKKYGDFYFVFRSNGNCDTLITVIRPNKISEPRWRKGN
jgi:hypothetical protein